MRLKQFPPFHADMWKSRDDVSENLPNLLLAVSRKVIYLCAESTELILLSNQNNLNIDTMFLQFFSLPLLGIADGGG